MSFITRDPFLSSKEVQDQVLGLFHKVAPYNPDPGCDTMHIFREIVIAMSEELSQEKQQIDEQRKHRK